MAFVCLVNTMRICGINNESRYRKEETKEETSVEAAGVSRTDSDNEMQNDARARSEDANRVLEADEEKEAAPEPASSTAAGSGLKQGEAGLETSFTINAVDKYGNPNDSDSVLTIQFSFEGVDEASQPSISYIVESDGNGGLLVRYTHKLLKPTPPFHQIFVHLIELFHLMAVVLLNCKVLST